MISSHIEFTHQIWAKLLKRGDIAIDATCGNGLDSLFIAKQGAVLYALDIQEEAIAKTKELLKEFEDVTFVLGCHSSFPPTIEKGSCTLIVYNLGYLPGGNKEFTTMHTTTMQSLNAALELVKPNGLISITCYPGHPEGLIEESILVEWAKMLERKQWNVSFHQWLNRKKAPSVLLLQKQLA